MFPEFHPGPSPGGLWIVRGGKLGMPLADDPHTLHIGHETIISSMCDFSGRVIRTGTAGLTLNTTLGDGVGNWLARNTLRLREGTTTMDGIEM